MSKVLLQFTTGIQCLLLVAGLTTFGKWHTSTIYTPSEPVILPPVSQPVQMVSKVGDIFYPEFDSTNQTNQINTNNGEPLFDLFVSPNITAIKGHKTILNCRISNRGNRTVVWVRHRDIHLLTVNQITYTSDERFRCTHNPETDVWSLQIRSAQLRDTGIYECQISTTPPHGIPIYLSVVEPITTILGGPILYINAGSTINLTCIVRNLPTTPSYVIWTHNNQEITFDSPRGGVSVITEKGEVTTSYLYIQGARSTDTGTYSCIPSNANNSTITVYIIQDEDEQYAAAIQVDQHHQLPPNGQQQIVISYTCFIFLLFISIDYVR